MSIENLMIKYGSADESTVSKLSDEDTAIVANDKMISERLEKFANSIQKIAPRSEDFLYFSIIFMKAAEAALLDDNGELKKVGNERAWGYFDDKFRWHGNVRPHKNRNNDIFPESELKKAARLWIGTPLCVDHKSDSVDGVRGIVLDTYYDEKRKQIVGLCAVDKVNYAELARKVQTGVVRYGSMGTGVETSICADCYNYAKTPADYCTHLSTRSAYGEINIGLKPIEYSLVVQPAEPAAILLKVIASIKEHSGELKAAGVDDIDEFTGKLSKAQAEELDKVLNSVCGENGCSISERKTVISTYLKNNNLLKVASLDVEDTFTGVENFTSEPKPVPVSSQGTNDYSGTTSVSLGGSDSGEKVDTFDSDGVGPESYLKSYSSLIKNLMEDIMSLKDKRLTKVSYHQGGSAGVEPDTYKSTDYKKYWEMEKFTKQDKSMGGTEGMMPGDKEVKEKQLRASDKSQGATKTAYHQGGSEGVEPNTYKSTDYKKYWEMEKFTKQDKSMGGTEGMMPGDKEVKEKQSRASLKDVRFSTKIKKAKNLDGSINKSASSFEVFANNKLVVATTVGTLFGSDVEKEWSWVTSPEYGKAVVASIREEGLDKVARVLTAQALPAAAPEMAAPEMGAPAPDMGAPDMLAGPEMDLGSEDALDVPAADASPKESITTALSDIEERIAEIKASLEKLGGAAGDVDVNINVGDEGADAEKVALSSAILRDLKTSLAEARESASELRKVSKALDRSGELSRDKKALLMRHVSAALSDAREIVGESTTLVKMANVTARSMTKTATTFVEPKAPQRSANPKVAAVRANNLKVAQDKLIAETIELRKNRRQEFLKAAMLKEKKAMRKLASVDLVSLMKGLAKELGTAEAVAKLAELSGKELSEEQVDSLSEQLTKLDGFTMEGEDKESDAVDGVGLPENAQIAGVTKDTGIDIAMKEPKGVSTPPGHVGNEEPKLFKEYPSTTTRDLAEKSNAAEDGVTKPEAHEIAKEEAKEEVDKHEDSMHKAAASLKSAVASKKVASANDDYKVKLHRAYDLAQEMATKGLIKNSTASISSQVDSLVEFDDKAFEAFKRTVRNVKASVAEPKVSVANIVGSEQPEDSGLQKQASLSADRLMENLKRLWQ